MVQGILLVCMSAPALANDDHDVIEAALLTAFVKDNSVSSLWRPEKHVVLRDYFAREKRPEFLKEVARLKKEKTAGVRQLKEALENPSPNTRPPEELKKMVKEYESNVETLTMLANRTIENSYQPEKEDIKPSQLTWDKRIVVSNGSNNSFIPEEERQTDLERGTIYAVFERPTYSPDGQYAIVTFHSPWSGGFHSASFSFVLERKKDKWKVVVIADRIYV